METNPSTVASEREENHQLDGLETFLASFRMSGLCDVCNNLKRRMLGDPKVVPQYQVASDFSPQAIAASAPTCQFCAVIVAAIEQFEPDAVRSSTPISRIYARGPAEIAPHTLTLEIYFKGPRHKLVLEIQSPRPTGSPTVAVDDSHC